MRVRNRSVSLWLTDKEYQHLQQQAAICGMKYDPFIRSLIMGIELLPRPPEEWQEVVRQIAAIGNNINQIAHVANMNKNIDPLSIDKLSKMQSQIWQHIKGL